jgi:GNAT superfamily N-acetyltransferase
VTERTDLPALQIHPLTPERMRDYLAFFDGEAFRDNPNWAGCYCYFYHADHSTREWEARGGEENRAAVCALIQAGRHRGYLAYLEGQPVAWCHAAPRRLIANVDRDPNVASEDADRVGSIVCFVVAPGMRGRGVGRALLRRACERFSIEGLSIAEAYPRPGADSQAANYHGPLEMYLREGFAVWRDLEDYVVVRKILE